VRRATRIAVLIVACGFAIDSARPDFAKPQAEEITMARTFADGIPATAEKYLADLYQTAADRISRAVTNPTGATFNARQFRNARAADLVRQIDETVARVKGVTAGWASRNLGAAYNNGLATAMQQLRKAGVSDSEMPVKGGFSQVDRRTVAVIAADMAVSLDSALSRQAKAAKRFLRATAQAIAPDSEISKVVAQGAITGDVRGTVRQMRGVLNEQQIDDYRAAGSQVIQVGKAQMTVRAYAEMLVRTRTREATVHARHERLVGNGFDLVVIVGRVSTNFCTAYLGRVFSITGGNGRYPALRDLPGGGPPFHPNCSKSTALYSERFATDAEKRHAGLSDERFVTTDAAEAQSLFNRKGEVHNAIRRYRTRTA